METVQALIQQVGDELNDQNERMRMPANILRTPDAGSTLIEVRALAWVCVLSYTSSQVSLHPAVSLSGNAPGERHVLSVLLDLRY